MTSDLRPINALDSIGKRDTLPRAELVRRAVNLFREEEKKKKSDDSLDKYFGFLKNCPEAFDGLGSLEYEQKIRGEWDHRDQMYSNWGRNEKEAEPFQKKGKENGEKS